MRWHRRISLKTLQPDAGTESRSALDEPDERTPHGYHAADSALGRGMYRSDIGSISGHGHMTSWPSWLFAFTDNVCARRMLARWYSFGVNYYDLPGDVGGIGAPSPQPSSAPSFPC